MVVLKRLLILILFCDVLVALSMVPLVSGMVDAYRLCLAGRLG